MHQSSLDKISAFRSEYLSGREAAPLKILDLGSCDVNGSYKAFFDSPSWKYIGVDLAPGNNVDVVLSDPYDWREIESSSIDVLISGQAFEHIEFFWLTMLEIARILKPEGLCCIIAPSGGFEHRYPVDCWRFYSDGFAALARFAGLEVMKVSTQWENLGYKDDSDKWKDTTLICKKSVSYNPGYKDYIEKSLQPIIAEKGKDKEVKDIPFNPLKYSKSLLQEPLRLTDVISWHEHIPFAFLIMQMLKPKLFVELGTHSGDSYNAFCQAVNTLGLDTRCYAVDTWKGDEQAGLYDEKVYTDLKAYHAPLYGKFSTLIRATFDEAVSKFEDGTIDLLHIDGLHTYDAVKHDFETWLPKMSESGVILFHDTNVRERDFGVWRLWEEIKEKYPTFEFKHGNGLGVVAIGSEIRKPLLELLSAGNENVVNVSQFFHYMGSRISIVRLKELQIAEKDRQIAEKDRQIVEKDWQIQALLNSYSWKITAPLRKLAGLLKK